MSLSEQTKPSWIESDRNCVWHPYTQMLSPPPPLPVERAEGVYLHTSDGRKILDGISSWWVNIHGHSHSRLNRAIRQQAEKFSQVIFAGFTHQPGAQLAEELVRRTPASLRRVFFSDDGSTAVEVALKMAYQYWRNQGQEQRRLFVAFEHAYHGDTFGAMAVGDVREFHDHFSSLFFEVRRARHDDDSLEQILDNEGTRVAAVIIEPMVEAAGGMKIWPASVLSHVRHLTKRHDIPLITDEVFTGFGRTGSMFACEHGPVEPDLMCLSKGLTGGYLPLAATLASEQIYQSFLSQDHSRTLFHGHSFTGNALSCAVALESLALFDEEQRLERVSELEGIFRERLAHLSGLATVREVRGIGALAVVELEPQAQAGYLDSQGPQLYRAFLDRGLLLRPLGNVLYFLPPYVITDAQVHWVFDNITEVLGQPEPR